MQHKDNYEISLQAAMKRFCGYDMKKLSQKPGVVDRGELLETRFFGMPARICKKTGQITVDGEPADFCEALGVFDWLCDGKTDAKASGAFCPVSSLPGVLVRGSGLMMTAQELAELIDQHPDQFRRICKKLGSKTRNNGDICEEIEIFPGLPMQIKFYHSDEEFPPSVTFLWDRNILSFVRYETVYYLAAALKKHLLHRLRQ